MHTFYAGFTYSPDNRKRPKIRFGQVLWIKKELKRQPTRFDYLKALKEDDKGRLCERLNLSPLVFDATDL